jgi:hypothetical protein
MKRRPFGGLLFMVYGFEHERGRGNSCFSVSESWKTEGFPKELATLEIQVPEPKKDHGRWVVFFIIDSVKM